MFAGRPSLKKLALWDDNGVFEDNITIATGRKQFEPQWVSFSSDSSRQLLTRHPQYGLQTAFAEIERLHHEVVSAGNPIGMDLKTRYVTKGIKKEQIIASRVNIFYDKDTGKITKVQDKWDGELPESSFKNVSIEQLIDPWWWVHYGEGWAWWIWSFTWDTWWWQVCGHCLSRVAAVSPVLTLTSRTRLLTRVVAGNAEPQFRFGPENCERSQE